MIYVAIKFLVHSAEKGFKWLQSADEHFTDFLWIPYTKYPRGIEEHTCYCSLLPPKTYWSNCPLALKLSRFRTCSFLLRVIFSIMFLKLDSSRGLRCSPMKKHSDRKISGILRNSGCILRPRELNTEAVVHSVPPSSVSVPPWTV